MLTTLTFTVIQVVHFEKNKKNLMRFSVLEILFLIQFEGFLMNVVKCILFSFNIQVKHEVVLFDHIQIHSSLGQIYNNSKNHENTHKLNWITNSLQFHSKWFVASPNKFGCLAVHSRGCELENNHDEKKGEEQKIENVVAFNYILVANRLILSVCVIEIVFDFCFVRAN